MKHFLRNMAIGCAALSVLALFGRSEARAAVRAEHPRIWLTPEFKTTLIARYARNTESANRLRTWCDAHMNDDLSTYIVNRAGEMGRAANYALMYQLTGNTVYANRAVQIIEYAFANPYGSYTIDTWIEFDNFYTTRFLVPPVAIVLDWCYDAMTPTQRSTFVAQLDRWAARIMTADQWAWHDPSNNYYYGYLWALVSAGYAIYGHNANAQQYIDYARGTMLDQAIKFTKGEQIMWELYGTTVGRAKGGMWNEGTSYGFADYAFLFSSVNAVKSAEGLPYSDFTFPNEAIKFLIYAKHPSGTNMYSEGDGTWGVVDERRRIGALLAVSLATGNEQRYGQHWVNTYVPAGFWESYKYYNEFIWYEDQLAGLDYRGALPDYYYIEGNQILFWRNSWNQDATWLSMKLGVLNTDHGHNGLGDITIFKNDFLATDKAAETSDGMLSGDIHHNVLYIPPNGGQEALVGRIESQAPREHGELSLPGGGPERPLSRAARLPHQHRGLQGPGDPHHQARERRRRNGPGDLIRHRPATRRSRSISTTRPFRREPITGPRMEPPISSFIPRTLPAHSSPSRPTAPRGSGSRPARLRCRSAFSTSSR